MTCRFVRLGLLLGLCFAQALGLSAQGSADLPHIVAQPAPFVRVREGGQLQLHVGAEGTPPLTYQWHRDGAPLVSYVSSDLLIPSVTVQDAGLYTVVVSNASGAVTSLVSTVSVSAPSLTPPSIVTHPIGTNNVIQGASFDLSVAAVGSLPFQYQWYHYGFPSAGGTNDHLNLQNLVYSDSGDYSVVVSNAGGSVTSLVARVIVLPLQPIVIQHPTNVVCADGSDFSLTATAVGAPSLAFQWYFGDSVVQNGTVLDMNGAVSNSVVSTLSITNASLAQSGPYRVVVASQYGVVTSQVAQVTMNRSAPYILDWEQPPQSSFTILSNSFSLSTVVRGTEPISLQWRRGDVAVPNATNALLNVSNAQFSDAGDYTLLAVNAFGATTSTVAHVTVYPWGPSIITQPEPITNVLQGTVVNVSAIVTGISPLYYQWYLDGQPITNATQSYLPVYTDPFFSTNGLYTVIVTNSYGTVTSEAAQITITPLRALDLMVDPSSTNANEILLPVYISSQTDEQEIQCSVQANPSVLSLLSAQLDLDIQDKTSVAFLDTNNPPVLVGPNSPQIQFLVDSSQLTEGRIGMSIALPTNAHLTAGRIRLATIKAALAPGANLASAALDWAETPLPIQVISTTEAHGTNYGLSVSRVAVGAQLGVGPAVYPSPIASVPNAQTGFFDQSLSIVNAGSKDLTGYTIWFKGLGLDSQTNQILLANSTDISARPANGWWSIQMGPLHAGATTAATAEYYIPDRSTLPTPTILGAPLSPGEMYVDPAPPLSEYYHVRVDRMLFVNGVFIVEFPSSENVNYYLQYIDDLRGTNWTTSLPPVKGTGTTAQWVDNGPPRTESRPTSQTNRFYRILLP